MLDPGPEDAASGMSQLIYQEMDRLLSPPLQEAVDKASADAKSGAQNALDEARKGWQKLAYSIAYGVIEHLKSDMVIKDIQTQGTVTTSISGSTGGTPGPLDLDHQHSVNLSVESANEVFDQVVGTGKVE